MNTCNHQDTKAGAEKKKSDGPLLAASHRDPSLDILKGLLVLVMVLYHAMNVFSTASPTDYSYVRFVSGSFILVSGYILGRFQDATFSKNPSSVSRRLVSRGLKLVILFTVLNLVIALTGFGNSTKEPLNFGHLGAILVDVFVVGVARAASFQILLPIGYVLISGPAFLWLGQRSRYALVAGLLLTEIIDIMFNDSVNMYFYTLGFIGVVAGVAANRHEVFHVFRNMLSALIFIISLEMIMKFAVTYLISYTICTILLVQGLYDLCGVIPISGRLAQAGVLLGRYSLICYIAQIIFLQSVSKALSHPRWELGYETILVSCATALFLFGLCASLQFLQRRYRCVAKAYDLVFL